MCVQNICVLQYDQGYASLIPRLSQSAWYTLYALIMSKYGMIFTESVEFRNTVCHRDN